MHATFVNLWLQVMQPLANVHETKWTPHVKRESDVAVHIIAVLMVTLLVSDSYPFSYVNCIGNKVICVLRVILFVQNTTFKAKHVCDEKITMNKKCSISMKCCLCALLTNVTWETYLFCHMQFERK